MPLVPAKKPVMVAWETQSLKYYLGIDPGMSGGLALLNGAKPEWVEGMPASEVDIWNTVWAMKLRVGKVGGELFAHIEWISHAMFGTNKGSMSKLYGSYKGLRMALVAAGIRFQDVKPKLWQNEMGIEARRKNETTAKWKGRLRATAQQLFRTTRVTLETADALLIAEHCRRKCEKLL